MRWKFTLNIGFLRSSHTKIVDLDYLGYDIETWEEEDPKSREQILQEAWERWSNDLIEGGWEEV